MPETAAREFKEIFPAFRKYEDVSELLQFKCFLLGRKSIENPGFYLSGDQKECPSKEILDYLNDAKRKLTGNEALRGFRLTPSVKRLITPRLKEKFTIEDFKAVIDFKCESWKDNKKMQEYIRPSTLFNASHFPEYLCAAESFVKDADPVKENKNQSSFEKIQEKYGR